MTNKNIFFAVVAALIVFEVFGMPKHAEAQGWETTTANGDYFLITDYTCNQDIKGKEKMRAGNARIKGNYFYGCWSSVNGKISTVFARDDGSSFKGPDLPASVFNAAEIERKPSVSQKANVEEHEEGPGGNGVRTYTNNDNVIFAIYDNEPCTAVLGQEEAKLYNERAKAERGRGFSNWLPQKAHLAEVVINGTTYNGCWMDLSSVNKDKYYIIAEDTYHDKVFKDFIGVKYFRY